MKLPSNLSVEISLAIIMVLSLTGWLITVRRKSKHAVGKTDSASGSERKTRLTANGRNNLLLAIFFVIFSAALVVLVNYLSVLPATPASEEASAPTPTSTATPTAIPTQPVSTSANQILRFDELDPILPLAGNLSVGSWSDGSQFSIVDRTYSYGIGFIFSGTSAEANITNAENSPDQIIRDDCKEFSAEYALRNEYSALVFSIGADNGNPLYYGDENEHGIAEVIITDKDSGSVLFDTGWVNYTYAIYEAKVDLTNVDVLKITYRTCGVSNLYKLRNGLRFAIVDPILVLKEDSE